MRYREIEQQEAWDREQAKLPVEIRQLRSLCRVCGEREGDWLGGCCQQCVEELGVEIGLTCKCGEKLTRKADWEALSETGLPELCSSCGQPYRGIDIWCLGAKCLTGFGKSDSPKGLFDALRRRPCAFSEDNHIRRAGLTDAGWKPLTGGKWRRDAAGIEIPEFAIETVCPQCNQVKWREVDWAVAREFPCNGACEVCNGAVGFRLLYYGKECLSGMFLF